MFKKAYDLSVMCDCQVGIVVRTGKGKWYEYATSDLDELLLRFTQEYTDCQKGKVAPDMTSISDAAAVAEEICEEATKNQH